ncbi:DNA-cytosine methyltransferase [uncultured Candidatus Thioglobus sp.]|nr:DNA-cytosine methyltransferase [uncultured Candidatus Thioglobus sp.]
MKKIEAIDLFCGVGGLTYGLQQANIKVLAGLDNDESCEYSYKKNNSVNFICKDVSNYDFKAMKKMYSKGSIKVLAGCAPCQTFSSHTFKVKNREKDVRWNMIDHFLRGIKTIEPDIISMENVRGITKTQVFSDFVKQVKKMKYKVSYEVVNCADYGIPQSRKRLIFLASKLGDIPVPQKTHTKENHIPINQIIKAMPTLKSGDTCTKDKVHKSRNLSKLNIKRIQQSKPSGTWRDWDKVSPTITTQFTSPGSGMFIGQLLPLVSNILVKQ